MAIYSKRAILETAARRDLLGDAVQLRRTVESFIDWVLGVWSPMRKLASG